MQWVGCLVVAGFLLAGCAAPASPTAPAGPMAPAPVDEPIDWAGHLGISSCNNGPVVYSCGATIGLGGASDSPDYLHQGGDGSLLSGTLKLEWAASSPFTQDLSVKAQVVTGCPEDCKVNRTVAADAGPSPITLSIPQYPLEANQTILVRVATVDFYPGHDASLGQDVHLTGTLRMQPAAASADAAPATGNETG